jgi:hypothetical protein
MVGETKYIAGTSGSERGWLLVQHYAQHSGNLLDLPLTLTRAM